MEKEIKFSKRIFNFSQVAHERSKLSMPKAYVIKERKGNYILEFREDLAKRYYNINKKR